MDVPSLLLRRRYCAECRITFDVAAPRDSKGRPEAVALWVWSPPRQIIKIDVYPIYFTEVMTFHTTKQTLAKKQKQRLGLDFVSITPVAPAKNCVVRNERSSLASDAYIC